jgi:prepilin-type N-terminal cleavage/methylation domain-containing protein
MKSPKPFLLSTFYFLRPRPYPRASRRGFTRPNFSEKNLGGFTLLEVLIATALFSIVIISFITILVSVTRVQVQQTSAAEVNQQSQFLLQEVQYYVGHASLIDMTADAATTTLRLRMAASSSDPTIVTVSGGIAYLQQAGGALQPLTSSKVSISNLTFTKRSNPPSHDSVDLAFTISYNTSNLQQMFSQMFQTSVARVSAASFDSNLVPSSTATYSLGAAGQTWTSVNNIIYFSGSNVGIGISSPQQTLEVNGGLRLNNSGSLPSCNSNSRGTLWFLEQAPGLNDSLKLCYENTSSTYQWATIF